MEGGNGSRRCRSSLAALAAAERTVVSAGRQFNAKNSDASSGGGMMHILSTVINDAQVGTFSGPPVSPPIDGEWVIKPPTSIAQGSTAGFLLDADAAGTLHANLTYTMDGVEFLYKLDAIQGDYFFCEAIFYGPELMMYMFYAGVGLTDVSDFYTVLVRSPASIGVAEPTSPVAASVQLPRETTSPTVTMLGFVVNNASSGTFNLADTVSPTAGTWQLSPPAQVPQYYSLRGDQAWALESDSTGALGAVFTYHMHDHGFVTVTLSGTSGNYVTTVDFSTSGTISVQCYGSMVGPNIAAFTIFVSPGNVMVPTAAYSPTTQTAH